MTRTIQFFVHGLPKGQPRPRSFAMKVGNKFTSRMYDPKTADGWKAQVVLAAKESLEQSGGFATAVHVGAHFFFPRPKHHFKRAELRVDAPQYHTAAPDADNLAKAVLDALTSVGMWTNDSLVSGLMVVKSYGAQPGAQIVIREMEGLDG